jgi:LysM repeat protein
MSTPSPLLPPGALEGAAAPKSRIRITVLTILALHVVFIGGLLLQGCNKEGTDRTLASTNEARPMPSLLETQYFDAFPGDVAARESPTLAEQTSAPPAFEPEPERSFTQTSVPEVAPTFSGSPTQSYTLPSPPPPSISSTSMASSSLRQAMEHVIEKGDTVGALAKRYGVSERAILDTNPDIRPRFLKIGDTLMIPAPTSPPPEAALEAAAPPGSEIYEVKSGDNLTRIARKYGVTVNQIRTANNIRGDRIVPKQRLIIPQPTTNPEGTDAGRSRTL